MLKKFNWGWGIAIFYGGFVVFMLTMVYRSTQMPVQLVVKDYYQEELKYQNHIDKANRANALKDPLKWNVANKTVSLEFPHEMLGEKIQAKVYFYRPNNSNNDFSENCTPDSTGNCVFTSGNFRKGVYNMQIDWSAGGQTYYNEGVININ